MAQITQDKVQSFISTVETKHDSFTEESMAKVIKTLDKLPLTDADVERLSAVDNEQLYAVVSGKRTQKYEDVQKALEDFCETNEGDVTVDDFAQWIGGDSSDVHALMDKAHVYTRLATKGRPETVAHW